MKPKNVRDIDFVLFCRLVAVCDDFYSAYNNNAELGGRQFDDISHRVSQLLSEVRMGIDDPAEVPGGVDGSEDAALVKALEMARRNEALQAELLRTEMR